jgi:hypothetical protein
MRRRLVGVCQVVILTAYICTSALDILRVEWPTSGRGAAYETTSALTNASPFAFEERLRPKKLWIAIWTDAMTKSFRLVPQPVGETVVVAADRSPTSVFVPVESERPPPA